MLAFSGYGFFADVDAVSQSIETRFEVEGGAEMLTTYRRLLITVSILQFKKEEKTNLNLINKALLHPKEFNIDELKVDLEREEKELEQKKREWEELKQKHAKEKRSVGTF